MTREEFMAERANGIGASEAAAACGLSGWTSQFKLYQQKRGEIPPDDATDDMDFGTIVEPSIARLYEHRHGVTLTYPLPRRVHPDPRYGFVFATGDAEESPTVGVELKSMNHFRAKLVKEHGLAEIVPEYLCQAQQQMAVMGWEVVKLVALVERRLEVWDIPRDDELIELILSREAELWSRIQRGDPPPVDLTREDALQDVRDRFTKVASGEFRRLSPEAAAAWKRRSELSAQIKALEEQRDRELAAVLLEIGDAAGGVLPGDGKVVKRTPVAASTYTVERKAFIQTRECNWKGGDIRPSAIEELTAFEEVVEFGDAVERIDRRLRSEGFLCNHVSPSGSRYFVHGEHNVRVRVSDHEPNQATRRWIKRNDVIDIRWNQSPAALLADLSIVTEAKERCSDARPG